MAGKASGKRNRDALVSRLVQAGFWQASFWSGISPHTLGCQPAAAAQSGRRLRQSRRHLAVGRVLRRSQDDPGELAVAFSISVTSASRSLSGQPLAYWIEVLEPLFAAIYAIPIILFPAAVRAVSSASVRLRSRPAAPRSLFPRGHQHYCGVQSRRPTVRDGGTIDGASGLSLSAMCCCGRVAGHLTGCAWASHALLSIIGSETLASLAGLGHRSCISRGDGDGAACSPTSCSSS